MRPPILTLDEDALKDEMRDLARGTVEGAINGIPDAQADELVDAGRCERTDERQAYGSGHYGRGPLTRAGKMEVGVPKLGGVRFTTEVTERHRRRGSSVGEALVEMHLLGASTRNIEDVTRNPWDEGLSAGAASSLSQGALKRVGAWRRRPLASGHPYAYVDGTYARRDWGGACESVAALVAIGANSDGCRGVVGVEGGYGESGGSRRGFLLGLGDRGLSGVGLVAGDEPAGMLGAPSEVFPSAERQRRTVRFHRDVLARVPEGRRRAVAAQPKAMHAQESPEAPARKAGRWPGR